MTENNASEKRVDRLCEGYLAAGRNQERNVICEWLVTIQGIPEDVRLRLVRGLMAGEHHQIIMSSLLTAENQVIHDLHIDPMTVMPVQLSPETLAEFGVPDIPDPVSDDQFEAGQEKVGHDN